MMAWLLLPRSYFLLWSNYFFRALLYRYSAVRATDPAPAARAGAVFWSTLPRIASFALHLLSSMSHAALAMAKYQRLLLSLISLSLAVV